MNIYSSITLIISVWALVFYLVFHRITKKIEEEPDLQDQRIKDFIKELDDAIQSGTRSLKDHPRRER